MESGKRWGNLRGGSVRQLWEKGGNRRAGGGEGRGSGRKKGNRAEGSGCVLEKGREIVGKEH